MLWNFDITILSLQHPPPAVRDTRDVQGTKPGRSATRQLGERCPPRFSPGRKPPSSPAPHPPWDAGEGCTSCPLPIPWLPSGTKGSPRPEVCVPPDQGSGRVSPSLAPAEEDKCKHCGQWGGRRLSGARQWKNSQCVTKARQRQVWVQAGQVSRELSLPRGFRCLKPNVS